MHEELFDVKCIVTIMNFSLIVCSQRNVGEEQNEERFGFAQKPCDGSGEVSFGFGSFSCYRPVVSMI